MPDKPVVGFIGLGIMGEPMALNVLKAGFPLVVHNRSRAAVQRLVAAGAQDGRSPAGVAQKADITLTCLPDSPDVETVVAGEEGILAGCAPGKIIVDHSTISPAVARRLAAQAWQKGVDFLDAPVSGGQSGARQATLIIMVGGSAAAFERALPVLQAEGKTIVRVGDSGAGQVTKACNQIIIAATNAIISEALVFAAKAGVDPATVRKVLMAGTSQSRILEMSGQRILDGNFQAGFKMRLHYKDLGIALETGRQNGCPMPTTSLVHELYAALVAAGKGDLDFSALSMLFEQLAATQIKRSI